MRHALSAMPLEQRAAVRTLCALRHALSDLASTVIFLMIVRIGLVGLAGLEVLFQRQDACQDPGILIYFPSEAF